MRDRGLRSSEMLWIVRRPEVFTRAKCRVGSRDESLVESRASIEQKELVSDWKRMKAIIEFD